MNTDDSEKSVDSKNDGEITRREFLKYSTWTTLVAVSFLPSFPSMAFECVPKIQAYPIDYSHVSTTLHRMLSFPKKLPGLTTKTLFDVSKYKKFGYGNWTFGAPLPMRKRTDIMPIGYSNQLPTRKEKFLNFFAFTDIHITDKEAPNQLIYLQQKDNKNAGNNTSIYSPVMMYTTHMLDAAIQTVNALHKQNPIDFGISLGDVCNSTQYNELRWYIDVIDGKVITPSSGANLGACTIDYQMPYKAAGLDKSITWYQVIGNHDHFFIGSFPVDADPALGIRKSYIAGTVWSSGDVLIPNGANFPTLFDSAKIIYPPPYYYMGLINGATKYGEIIKFGAITDPKFVAGAPKIVADPNRRSLLKDEWLEEFYNTTTSPVGHGFDLVDQSNPAWETGFACYSFMPKTDMPIKVIVLDNTQSENDGSTDIHGHGYLDANRWAWLQAELAAGQAANQLMIIAAHIPICVSAIGSETEWWAETKNIAPQNQNAVTLTKLVNTLQNTPNLLMWIAGHRHMNVVKAFVSPNPQKNPEKGFWQVETSSLRDFPQQFRTFEIYLNSDYTVSIVTTNVDPAVKDGTPAATSRKYAIATQQIVQNNLTPNNNNYLTYKGIVGGKKLPSMDPSRPQLNQPDPTIKFVDLTAKGVPYNASYNAELFKQLSPQMVRVLKAMYPLG